VEITSPTESPLQFAAFFVVMWITVSISLSTIGGWRRLAEYYRLNTPFAGTKWHFRSASFRRFVGYNGVLTVGASPEGLYLSVLFPFRIGHPPLLIPWQHVRKFRPSALSIFSIPLALGEHDPVRVSLSKRLVHHFEESYGRELASVA
jgi:hypothetical protein